jgi:hypothetical protein
MLERILGREARKPLVPKGMYKATIAEIWELAGEETVAA